MLFLIVPALAIVATFAADYGLYRVARRYELAGRLLCAFLGVLLTVAVVAPAGFVILLGIALSGCDSSQGDCL